MLRRITALPRPAAALARVAPFQARAYAKPAASNVVLELDAKKVGNEIRKRGLTNAVANRDGGMDRVSVAQIQILSMPIRSLSGHDHPPPLLARLPPGGRALPPHLYAVVQGRCRRWCPPRGQVCRSQVGR